MKITTYSPYEEEISPQDAFSYFTKKVGMMPDTATGEMWMSAMANTPDIQGFCANANALDIEEGRMKALLAVICHLGRDDNWGQGAVEAYLKSVPQVNSFKEAGMYLKELARFIPAEDVKSSKQHPLRDLYDKAVYEEGDNAPTVREQIHWDIAFLKRVKAHSRKLYEVTSRLSKNLKKLKPNSLYSVMVKSGFESIVTNLTRMEKTRSEYNDSLERGLETQRNAALGHFMKMAEAEQYPGTQARDFTFLTKHLGYSSNKIQYACGRALDAIKQNPSPTKRIVASSELMGTILERGQPVRFAGEVSAIGKEIGEAHGVLEALR